jgi:hypothetical protein
MPTSSLLSLGAASRTLCLTVAKSQQYCRQLRFGLQYFAQASKRCWMASPWESFGTFANAGTVGITWLFWRAKAEAAAASIEASKIHFAFGQEMS